MPDIPIGAQWAALTLSFSMNVFFLQRLLRKVDNIGTALFNPKDGALIRIDRLEHAAERRAFVQGAGLLSDQPQ